MLIQVGHNSYRIIKKRAYRKRTLINKKKGKSMIAYILGSFAVLTLLTAGYNLIPANKIIYNAPVSAPEVAKINLKVKADIIADETPKATIERLAKENEFKWPEYLSRLAFFESSYNSKAVNKNKNGSTDRGLFQWNDKAHPEITDDCAFSVECSTLATMKAINAGHQGWWMADRLAKRKN